MTWNKVNFKQGFTLLELLVVIVIIGIASTIIVLKTGHLYLSNKNSATLANDIAALFGLAKKQAIFTTSTLGLRISASEYGFVKLEDINGLAWKPLDVNDPFWAARAIPSNIVIELQSQDKDQKNFFQKVPFAPQIMILPSGDITPFTMNIHQVGSKQTYTIRGDASGSIAISKTE